MTLNLPTFHFRSPTVRWLAATGLVLFCVAAHAGPPNASELARRIDQRMEQYWQANGIQPAAVADETTYLRRVSLDLIGRIPTVPNREPGSTTPILRNRSGSSSH
jgi:hypothetical protein